MLFKLKELIKHSYQTTEYYKKLYDENGINPNDIRTIKDLKNIPVLEKNIIQSNYSLFLSNKYNVNELVKSRTSGSTGKLLTVYWRKEDMFRSLYPLWRIRYKLGGITTSDLRLSFHSFIYNGDKVETPKIIKDKYSISFSKLNFEKNDLNEAYRNMIEFSPEWIDMAPNCLFLFTKHMVENKLPIPKVRHTELSGEYYLDEHRKYIEDAFGIKSFNQYGCREANVIAYECQKGNLHLLDNVIININNKDEDGFGDVCITVISNYAMPIIRYNLGDIGRVISNHSCDCGKKSPIIEIKSSRQADMVYLNNDKVVYSSIFLVLIERINKELDNCISQFRVIQNSIENFECHISFFNEASVCYSEFESCFIRQSVELELTALNWKFFYHNIISYDAMNKYKYFIRK